MSRLSLGIGIIVLSVAAFFISTFCMRYGWNNGMVPAVDGTHPIDFWGASAMISVIGSIGAAFGGASRLTRKSSS